MFFSAGGIIIAGGYSGSAEGLGMEAPPALPSVKTNFPLVLVGSTLHLCGGYPSTADCYTLNTEETNPTWKKNTGLPRAMNGHSGVAMGTHIWYVHHSTLYDYNTITGTTEKHAISFTNAYRHCAVANETHSYVAGVGTNSDEIWVNGNARDPTQWTLVTKLPIAMHGLSCVWFQGTIYMQGGNDKSGNPLKDAFALDINSHSLLGLAGMTTARWEARAAILNCKPAVIGGLTRGHRVLTSIETFDGSAWTLHEMSLKTPRRSFGLVQFYK